MCAPVCESGLKDMYIRTSQVIFMYIPCIYIYIYIYSIFTYVVVQCSVYEDMYVLCLVTVDSMLKVHSIHCDSLSMPLSLPVSHPESNTGQQKCIVDCSSWFKCSHHICLSKRIFACQVIR